MKKCIVSALLFFGSAICSFAGDAAAFSDIGFSDDGKTYVFGEYGKTDQKFQAWAEIYAVDVEKNEYVPHEVFITNPSAKTGAISGKKAYEELLNRSKAVLQKYKCRPAAPASLLYVRDGSAKNAQKASAGDEIVFKDYEASHDGIDIYYHIRLVPTYEGTGKNVQSKYYIDMQKQDGTGRILQSWQVGNPDYKRKGISSYHIERIFTDESGRSLVFIIQKTLEDDTGTSIRYMVETVRL